MYCLFLSRSSCQFGAYYYTRCAFRVALLNIPQDLAHHALTTTPRSVTIRARADISLCTPLHLFTKYVSIETRRTYRAVLSEPKAVVPEGSMDLLRTLEAISQSQATSTSLEDDDQVQEAGMKRPRRDDETGDGVAHSLIENDSRPTMAKPGQQEGHVKNLGMERGPGQGQGQGSKNGEGEGPAKKKKRKKNNRPLETSVGT